MGATLRFRALQDPEVDRESAIVAATVAAAAAAGHIDRVLYWHEPLAQWVWYDEPIQPVPVPIGTEFHLSLAWVNDGTGVMTGHMELTITKPDGSQVTPDVVLNQDQTASPGSGWIVAFDGVVLDQEGAYQATAVLKSGGHTLDTKTFHSATVGAGAVSGEISTVYLWNANTGTWETLPPTITSGQEAGVGGVASNTSGYVENMRLDAVVTAPDGTQTTLTGDVVSVAGGGSYQQVHLWVCDQVGVYKVTLVLYAELA